MSKYKITYKAGDNDLTKAKQAIPKELKQWLKSNDFKFQYAEGFGIYYQEKWQYETATSDLRIGIIVYYDDFSIEMWQISPFSDEYVEFGKEELKLFDSLGLRLSATHVLHTHQAIEDWYDMP